MKRQEIEHLIREKYLPEARERGGPIPAIRSIAATLGVSKETVRRAVDALRKSGEVTTRHGAGVFPASRSAAASRSGEPAEPSSMFDIEERDVPVIRCLVKDNRENPALQRLAAEFNARGGRYRIQLHHRGGLDKLQPSHDFDILLAGADMVHSWHPLLGFRELRGLTDLDLDDALAPMFPHTRAACRAGDRVIGIPILAYSMLLFAHESFLDGERETDLDWRAFLELAGPHFRDDSVAYGVFARRLTFVLFAAGLWPGLDGTGMAPRRAGMRKALLAMKEGAELFCRPPADSPHDMRRDFADGSLPFIATGTGDLRRVAATSGGDLVVRPLPFGEKRVPGDAILGAIHPDCLRPRQAMEFLLFLMEKSSQEALARGGLDLPARADCFEAACPDEKSAALYAQVRACVENAESVHTGVVPYGAHFMREEVFPQVHLYLDGEAELDEVLDDIERLARRFKRRIARLVESHKAQEHAVADREVG